jgi:hypothetical protein
MENLQVGKGASHPSQPANLLSLSSYLRRRRVPGLGSIFHTHGSGWIVQFHSSLQGAVPYP